MSITLHGEPEPVGTKENPAVASFLIRNKETDVMSYVRGQAVTFHHPMAESVRITSAGGVAKAINKRVANTGVGIRMGGGKGRTWTGFSPFQSFFYLSEPGTLTLTVLAHDGRILTLDAHIRPPTPEEMEAAFESGRVPLNADLIELVSREDEAKAMDRSVQSVPEPEEDVETHLLAIEDAVEKLRGRL